MSNPETPTKAGTHPNGREICTRTGWCLLGAGHGGDCADYHKSDPRPETPTVERFKIDGDVNEIAIYSDDGADGYVFDFDALREFVGTENVLVRHADYLTLHAEHQRLREELEAETLMRRANADGFERVSAHVAEFRRSFGLCKNHEPDIWEGDGTCVICEGVENTRQLTALQDAVKEKADAFKIMAREVRERHARAAFATCANQLYDVLALVDPPLQKDQEGSSRT